MIRHLTNEMKNRLRKRCAEMSVERALLEDLFDTFDTLVRINERRDKREEDKFPQDDKNNPSHFYAPHMKAAIQALEIAHDKVEEITGYSGGSGNWGAQEDEMRIRFALHHMRAGDCGKHRRRITQVAIKFGGDMFALPAPNRHHDVIRLIVESKGIERAQPLKEDQGFLDEKGNFLSRTDAFVNAFVNEQIKGDPIIPGTLYSEDLW